jgi:uncharacterized protein YacL
MVAYRFMPDKTRDKFNISMKLLNIILVIALLISYVVSERLFNHGSNHFRINIIVPWGLIAIFISFYLFNEFNRVKRAKRDERREYMNEHRQELLNSVLKKNKNSDSKND